jgi:hypothetical protein
MRGNGNMAPHILTLMQMNVGGQFYASAVLPRHIGKWVGPTAGLFSVVYLFIYLFMIYLSTLPVRHIM